MCFFAELKDYCTSMRDCREHAYICSRSSCECAVGYRADEKNRTCLGGEKLIPFRMLFKAFTRPNASSQSILRPSKITTHVKPYQKLTPAENEIYPHAHSDWIRKTYWNNQIEIGRNLSRGELTTMLWLYIQRLFLLVNEGISEWSTKMRGDRLRNGYLNSTLISKWINNDIVRWGAGGIGNERKE